MKYAFRLRDLAEAQFFIQPDCRLQIRVGFQIQPLVAGPLDKLLRRGHELFPQAIALGILCFPSMTRKGVSKIRQQLSPGANVTIPRNYVDYIVTEYGVARMKGRSVLERTRQLIAIAHPDVREELTYYAKQQFYI